MENTQHLRREMDGEVFSLRLSWQFCFVNNLNEVFFPTFHLIWRVNSFVSHHGKGINRKKESTSNNNIFNCTGSTSRKIIDNFTKFCLPKLELKLENLI